MIAATQSEIPLYGLIGYPLAHSFSTAYFSEKFARKGINAAYTAFELEHIKDLPQLLSAHSNLKGLNVTTPHKLAVLPFMTALSKDAEAIGAVNCISIKGTELRGYNTDWLGFTNSLSPLLQSHHSKALVLGTGGASMAIRYALERLNIPYHTVSRTKEKGDYTYQALTPTIIGQHPIIINTTTLGTKGIGCPDIPYNALTPQHLLFDLVYNPAVTPFLAQGMAHGSLVKNGLEMLQLQAEASWNIWQQA